MNGIDCDVSNSASVARLASYAKSKLGRIDVWINNAGYSGSFQVHSVRDCCHSCVPVGLQCIVGMTTLYAVIMHTLCPPA